jgi:hypothetical protein
LGNLTRAAEEARATWGWTWLEQWYHDVQYAFRTVRHNIGLTDGRYVAGARHRANTAILSLIDALTLRWLPVGNPQELVELKLRSARPAESPGESFANAIVGALMKQKAIFSNVCGFSAATFPTTPLEVRTLSKQVELFGVASTDPRVVAGAAAFLVAVGMLAAYFPARRATLVDPITTLRHE